jgi:hypothetical protein
MLLHILWGMFFGYILASVRYASIIVFKGYSSIHDIPDAEDIK